MTKLPLKKLLSLLPSLAFTLLTLVDAFAATESFTGSLCNLTNIVTGNGGKAFAAFAIVSVGIGFFTGKVSWGLLIGVSVGVGSIFAAPSIVAAISGQSVYECTQGATYVTTCAHGVCSSCPAGRYGNYCCPIGYDGEGCNVCATGYEGAGCATCSASYTKLSDGACVNNSCTSGAIVGIAAASITVNQGSSSMGCTSPNYVGTVSYSCNNNIFTVVSNSCACPAKYNPSDCTTCAAGYQGSGCNNCATGYTKIGNACLQDCVISGKPGIADGTIAIPPSGDITCTTTGGINYSGIVSYTCSGGVFSGNACSVCEAPNIFREDQTCTPGNSCLVALTGVASQTVAHLASGSLSCDTGYSGSITYNCNDGSLNPVGSCISTACTGPGSSTGVTSGGFTTHTFTSNGTLTCTGNHTVDILVVGGGGSGGNHANDASIGGGGGGGVIVVSSFSLPANSYSITIGAGASGVSGSAGNNGSASSFSGGGISITAAGGGKGLGQNDNNPASANGGSGGGGHCSSAGGSSSGNSASGVTGATIYGNSGGSGTVCSTSTAGGGGGGGAGGSGGNGSGGTGGAGGSGITFAGQVYGSGGGGNGSAAGGAGGTNAGNGLKKNDPRVSSIDAVANRGGGGGGASSGGAGNYLSGSGGSGIVIIRY